MRVIHSRLHGVIDYLLVLFLFLAPSLFEMVPMVATLTYIIGGIHLLLTIFTNFPVGLLKVVPFRLHGLIEIAVGILILFLPWIFGFSTMPVESNFYLALGGSVLLVWILTDYRS